MFRFIKGWIRHQEKHIAFLDGDQDVPAIVNAYVTYLKGIETYCIRQCKEKEEPRGFRKQEFNKIFLDGFTSGKEVTDKFISGMIQKSIASGYNVITVVSNDYDFFDIFKMSLIMNPDHKDIKFRLIIPNKSHGKVASLTSTSEIEVIKVKG